MKKNIIYLLILMSISILSCDESDPNIKETETKAMAGEWWITYTVDGDDVSGGHVRLITSNTAANVNNEILVSDYIEGNDDAGTFWSYKIKANVDATSKTFTANEVVSSALYEGEPYDIKVNILNGKIIPGAGHSKTGVTVDSIYFEVQFEDDDPAFGTTYVASGHKRTGFIADDY
jgi:hypothetical protein